MEQKDKKGISRREFLKITGAARLATAGLTACLDKNAGREHVDGKPLDEMTYRTTPSTGDRVSLLGYGMMRLPMRKRADGNGEEVD